MRGAAFVRLFVDHLSTEALIAYEDRRHGDARFRPSQWISIHATAKGTLMACGRNLAADLAGYYTRGVRLELLGAGVLAPPRLIAMTPLCATCWRPFGQTGTNPPEADHAACGAFQVPWTAAVIYARVAAGVTEAQLEAGAIGAVRDGAPMTPPSRLLAL